MESRYLDMGKIQYLIVGCPRSGTVYMAKLLTELGFPCGHETIFNEKGIFLSPEDWKLSDISVETTGSFWVNPRSIVADSSYMAVPFLGMIPDHVNIIHIVRNPIKVVRSLVHGLNYFQKHYPANPWEEFIEQYLPETFVFEHPIERACFFYYSWNQMIKKRNVILQVECLDKILEYLDSKDKKVTVSNKTNTFSYEKMFKTGIDLSSIPDGSVKDDFINYASSINYKLENKIY